MLRGHEASPAEVAALDTYLVTVADHGLNASTFAARVVASTRAGLTSAVLAGISALKGPLHGGAPGPVIEMLDQIASPANARAWLEGALDRGDRLMGFGHRVYRVRDPRADALKRAVAALADASPASPGRLALAEAVETAALAVLRERKPDRSLQTNVELYTALLLEALAFPPSAFTCVFAMGRVAGWIAHAREQLAGGRLIRPQSRYVGPPTEGGRLEVDSRYGARALGRYAAADERRRSLARGERRPDPARSPCCRWPWRWCWSWSSWSPGWRAARWRCWRRWPTPASTSSPPAPPSSPCATPPHRRTPSTAMATARPRRSPAWCRPAWCSPPPP